MPTIDPRIFRAYDIRGKALKQLTEDAARMIGQAYGNELKKRYEIDHLKIVVGRDMRTHSPQLERAVIEGLVSAGCDVLTMGQTPSPVNYFTICHLGLDGGVQVTASHNPTEDNGLKLQMRDAEAFAGEDIQRLRQVIEQLVSGLWNLDSHAGSERLLDAITPYTEFLSKLFANVGNGLKVVADFGNGVAGPVYGEVLRSVGCELETLYEEPDGTFPNHPADPSKWDTLGDLQAQVKKSHAHIGLAFDGDGDRLGVVDASGRIRSSDEILLLLAQDHLKRHPGAPIVFTVSNSSILETEIRKWGGVPVMCPVGHSFVEHEMRRSGALLGGEQSGHFFCFEDYFGFDDALVATLRILKILQEVDEPRLSAAGVMTLSALLGEFPKVYQAPERRPFCPDDAKESVIERVIAHFQNTYPVNTMDGARIDFGDGAWAGIRKSNTSPCLSICIEARTEEKLLEVERIVLGHLESYEEVEL